ncbi:MAG TPA: hypothetical protein PLW49_01220 [bacterium]|nr:hypothetical protein [bacterium]
MCILSILYIPKISTGPLIDFDIKIIKAITTITKRVVIMPFKTDPKALIKRTNTSNATIAISM